MTATTASEWFELVDEALGTLIDRADHNVLVGTPDEIRQMLIEVNSDLEGCTTSVWRQATNFLFSSHHPFGRSDQLPGRLTRKIAIWRKADFESEDVALRAIGARAPRPMFLAPDAPVYI